MREDTYTWEEAVTMIESQTGSSVEDKLLHLPDHVRYLLDHHKEISELSIEEFVALVYELGVYENTSNHTETEMEFQWLRKERRDKERAKRRRRLLPIEDRRIFNKGPNSPKFYNTFKRVNGPDELDSARVKTIRSVSLLPEEIITQEEETDLIKQELYKILGKEEAEVLMLRFGLSGNDIENTFNAIAKKMGWFMPKYTSLDDGRPNDKKVSRMIRNALNKLKGSDILSELLTRRKEIMSKLTLEIIENSAEDTVYLFKFVENDIIVEEVDGKTDILEALKRAEKYIKNHRKLMTRMRVKVPDKFIVRLYDGFDNEWVDITTEPVSEKEAKRIWAEKTNNGKEKTRYADIDYYKIFPVQ